MAAISLPGLSTGIDTAALVRQLLAAESGRLNLVKINQARYQEKIDAFGTFESRLETLKTAVDELRSASDLRAYSAATNNQNALTVEASSSAAEGSHEIVIHQLAAANRQVHAGVQAIDTKLGAGTFAYTYNGTTRTVQTTADTTLENLRDLVNNDGGNPGVTASILEYDAGEGKVFHLVLGGNDTGADYAIAIDDEATTLDAFDSATFTTTQAAQDSMVRVDGYPSGAWISRSGNTLDDVLAGVTLHLQEAGDTAVRISLTRNTDSVKEKLKDLVSAYNAVVSYAQEKTAYSAATRKGEVLMGEFAVTAALHDIRMPFAEPATGFVDGQDPLRLAGQIGLSVNQAGQLELDEDKLDEALTDNYLGTLAVIGAKNTGSSSSDTLKFYGATDATTAGVYDVRAVFDGGALVSAQIKLHSEGDAAWRSAAIDGNLIIGAAGNPEHNLQVTATYSGSGTQTAEVRVRQGVAGNLYNRIEDMLDKTIDLAKGRYETSVKQTQKQIDTENSRLAQYEERLTAQYARLEQQLTLLSAQRSALTSYFG